MPPVRRALGNMMATGEDNNDAAANMAAMAVQQEMFNAIGFDVPRQWVTAAQAFRLDGVMMLVFREQMSINAAPVEPASMPPVSAQVARNIASLVMPMGVAVELAKIIQQMAAAEGTSNAA